MEQSAQQALREGSRHQDAARPPATVAVRNHAYCLVSFQGARGWRLARSPLRPRWRGCFARCFARSQGGGWGMGGEVPTPVRQHARSVGCWVQTAPQRTDQIPARSQGSEYLAVFFKRAAARGPGAEPGSGFAQSGAGLGCTTIQQLGKLTVANCSHAYSAGWLERAPESHRARCSATTPRRQYRRWRERPRRCRAIARRSEPRGGGRRGEEARG